MTILPTEKRSRTDIARLRQGLRCVECVVSWVPGRAYLFDPMTKTLGEEGTLKSRCDRLKQNLLEISVIGS